MTLDEAMGIMGGIMEPSIDEKKNGWTPETLTVYHAERSQTAFDTILNPPNKKPIKTKNGMKWL